MENTSATIFGDFFCVDSISFNDRNYVGVNAHELDHQWFGNLVTATNGASLTAYGISEDGNLTKAARLAIPARISDIAVR